MLQSTFHRLLHGVNRNLEAAYWRQGLLTWEDLEKRIAPQANLFQDEHVPEKNRPFAQARLALQSGNASYFANLLDRREHYRIPLSFPEKTLFLDIETTGLSRYYDFITLVGWSYQGKYGVFIKGDSDESLRRVLADACAIVTFNGSLFDLPFLREGFNDLPFPPVHIDLRFLAKRVNLSGGQKVIEEVIGFKRPPRLAEVKGESAPILWHQYRRGNMESLKLLVEYNYCDILGMKFIFDKVVDRLLKQEAVPHSISKRAHRFFDAGELVQVRNNKSNDLLRQVELSPYQGPIGPRITLDNLAITQPNPLRVVGIDLTGSEERPSGWCLLNGSESSTCTIGKDEDLITTTLNAHPHLVSIDSPLSLPNGRIRVSDDDPGRKEYGIMRYCERLLKKRGINVYPALIPSMQKLTARGIRLAATLRSKGIPVIESYPGAAQDIMGIPRKRASLDMLKEGLAEFGISGPFIHEQLTHDELDAITSAVVGAFFWSGKFESLGLEHEEALIIPDLEADSAPWQKRAVIGISGHIAAGKTTASHYLESHGFHYARYSKVLADLMKQQGIEVSRPALQLFGEKVSKEFGQRWLGRKLLENLPNEGNIVIDGLRFADDFAFLVEAFGPGFHLVHIDASEEARKERFDIREGIGASFDEAQLNPVERQVELLRSLAHKVIYNEGTLESLHSSLKHLTHNNFVEA